MKNVNLCFFLTSEQCKWHKECNGKCECGDVGCPADDEGTVTTPPQKNCPSGIEYHPGLGWIHWTCINSDPEFPEVSSPYNPTATMYPNTQCFTTHQ